MREAALREAASDVFASAAALTATRPALEALHSVIERARERLDRPMRVAIIGRIKAGKSTMMNALLGEALAATGAIEATFNVNWFCFGPAPAVEVHFKDGRPPEARSLADLDALTRRAADNMESLLAIRYIKVFSPNPILRRFDLIDTPGMSSYFQDDSENTRRFLALYGGDLAETTRLEAAQADAVLLLFSKGLASSDQDVVDQFQGQSVGDISPINAIGVLTKIDAYWPSEADPLTTGHSVARQWAGDPSIRRRLYDIHPVGGLLAFGARTMTDAEFGALVRLAGLPRERFDRLIGSVERFEKGDYRDVPVPAAEREPVLARLGQFGVQRAYDVLASGVGGLSKPTLCERLLNDSGLPQMLHRVESHFGNRAFLIKLSGSLRHVREACFRERQLLAGEDRDVIEEVYDRCEALVKGEHAFRELEVLQSHYAGALAFGETQVRQLLEVTGEFGTSAFARLGQDERATLAELQAAAMAREQSWRLLASDPLHADAETSDAARDIARSFQRIRSYVEQARVLLDV